MEYAKNTTREQQKQWLENDYDWPNWPYQTLKRRKDHQLECGIITNNNPTCVYLCNIFLIPEGGLQAKDENDEYIVKHERYESFDAMLDAGWEVD